jgi:hypothetical protein
MEFNSSDPNGALENLQLHYLAYNSNKASNIIYRIYCYIS